MTSYANNFKRYMDAKGIKYTIRDEEKGIFRVSYNGDNLKTIPVIVFFDKDSDPFVTFKCWEIASFKGKEAKGILKCNDLNNHYRWVKYCIDDDGDLVCSIDAVIDSDCGAECMSLIRRIVNITDEAYPEIMKCIWG